jgi:hypothetical protein
MAPKRPAKEHKHLHPRKSGEEKGAATHLVRYEPPVPGMAVLQHQIGNRAVQRALAQQASEPGNVSDKTLMRKKTANPAQAANEAGKEEVKTPSGASWVQEFPTSTDVSDLDSSFSGKVQKFVSALEEAGAAVTITATKRPLERAYLMHWAWMIVKKGYDPRKIPAMKGVDINWWHGDQKTSKDAAQEMVDSYGINKLKVPPSLKSNHITGKAIDMKISWSGELTIKNAKGVEVLIKTSPKDHTNRKLIAVGKTYQVIHFIDIAKDKVHWSVNGH